MTALERALGVSRVARVTGLDRAGVEVACAVRPLGHVLQVANGKGLSWKEARATALSEAAELWAAERVDARELLFGSARELGASLGDDELVAPRLLTMDTRIAWRRGRELASGREVLVPAQAVHCPPRGAPPLGPAAIRWTTNGMGAHPGREEAIRHALLELRERDQLARALPQGWTPHAIRTRKLEAGELGLWQQLRDARLLAHLFDLSGELPVVGAILFDLDEGPVPVTAGYACGETPSEAAMGALLEAAQSRLTEVHGAREDVAQSRPAQRGLREACEAALPSRKLSQLPSARLPSSHTISGRRIAPAGAVVIELAAKPLYVVKVRAPGMRVSELL
ncbi:MAG TPA: YcaO-like family protein [Myxococcales bacterium]